MASDAPRALDLPQVHAVLDAAGEPRVLVLGGRAPEREWLRAAALGREVWAVDRGAEACRSAGIVPSRLVGDLDSISGEGRRWAEERGIPVDLYPAEKDDTDFQLALGLSQGREVLVTGCWGGRFDHAFSNVFSALLPGRGARVLCLADERELLFPLAGPATLRLKFRRRPLALSLLSLTAEARGVTARGVRWPLDGATLRQSSPREVSNVPLGEDAAFSVQEGALGVYAAFTAVNP